MYRAAWRENSAILLVNWSCLLAFWLATMCLQMYLQPGRTHYRPLFCRLQQGKTYIWLAKWVIMRVFFPEKPGLSEKLPWWNNGCGHTCIFPRCMIPAKAFFKIYSWLKMTRWHNEARVTVGLANSFEVILISLAELKSCRQGRSILNEPGVGTTYQLFSSLINLLLIH